MCGVNATVRRCAQVPARENVAGRLLVHVLEARDLRMPQDRPGGNGNGAHRANVLRVHTPLFTAAERRA